MIWVLVILAWTDAAITLNTHAEFESLDLCRKAVAQVQVPRKVQGTPLVSATCVQRQTKGPVRGS